ncbi:hypothetical protein R6Q59_024060 [Mikania micrantha]
MVAACVAPTAPAWRLGFGSVLRSPCDIAYSGDLTFYLQTLTLAFHHRPCPPPPPPPPPKYLSSNLKGHDILMAIMLNGAAIMDEALLFIAANESCPQPQTSEHLAAVDLIQENIAINQHEAIQKFIQGTIADGAQVIPYIIKWIPIPERNFISPPNMIVIRSFDVNNFGSEVDEIKGGVASGSILELY